MTRSTAIVVAVSLTVLLSGSMATADLVVVDPDAFAAGTVLNNAYSGVTLTAHGDPGVLSNSNVVAVASSLASTGGNIFGNTETFDPDSWGNGNWDYLRADFDAGALWVSLDFISNDSGGDINAELVAFDSAGVEIDRDGPHTVTAPAGTFQTLKVTGTSIAYVHAYWDNITRSQNGALDNLQFAPVPVPGAVLLGMLGLGVAGAKLRKRA